MLLSVRVDTNVVGRIFGYPVQLPWEFTSARPIRSVFPLWLVYGGPMLLLHALWDGAGNASVPPEITYWALRLLMFSLSFVLQDWALHELIAAPRRRRTAVLLVASSYVTWTYQTHTFSNAVETLLLLWCLVLTERVVRNSVRSRQSVSWFRLTEHQRAGTFTHVILAFLIVLGLFNRITFPAFLLVSAARLLLHFLQR